MTITPLTTELGHSLPPEEHHTITFHIPKWENALRFRNKDKELFSKMVSMYPRFAPFAQGAKLASTLHTALSLPPTHAVLPFTHPSAFPAAIEFATSSHRKPETDIITPGELLFRVVDVGSVRLYVVVFPVAKAGGIMGLWQNNGTGVSTRLAEELLNAGLEGVRVLGWEATGEDYEGGEVPEATYLPEGAAHRGLRERIVGLLGRARTEGEELGNGVKEDDVYLYSTGMAAIYYLHRALTQTRKGAVVVLGAVFHNSWHVFEEQSPDGFKHFGKCDEERVLDELEGFLEEERVAGRRISHLFVEFPSNPILVSVDLRRLRELADKYDFPLVVDDTVGSFCNVDVLPVADVIVTSLTKSFSGYANVMGGSVVLNPSLPLYASTLKPTLTASYHNEYYSGDAEKLLANSADYLARSAILNRNALAIAKLAHSYTSSLSGSAGPVLSVLYPPFTSSLQNYHRYMRPATDDFTPGYGCLLSIDFVDKETAIRFYDNLVVHKSPHLGAHLTLALPFNELVWGAADDVDYHVEYGLRGEQVRVSVGLEEESELVEVFRTAFEAAFNAV